MNYSDDVKIKLDYALQEYLNLAYRNEVNKISEQALAEFLIERLGEGSAAIISSHIDEILASRKETQL